MAATIDGILQDALHLAPEARVLLAEKIVESIEAEIPPGIEKAHLAEVRRRQSEIEAGQVQLIPGDQALKKARRVLQK